MLAAGVGVDFDGITDFGIATMGADGAWSNTTYFNADQVHPTLAGYALMAPIAAAAVNALP
ncbi:lysophospholipase L1-like esterase [Bradyrhizobium sp. F1.13.4]